MWKSAALIAARLRFNGAADDEIIAGLALLAAAAHALRLGLRHLHAELRYDAVIELGVLVVVDTLLATVRRAVEGVPPARVWVLLLATVNVVELALGALHWLGGTAPP